MKTLFTILLAILFVSCTETKLDELYLMRTKENKKLYAELKKLRKENSQLINKICLLEN
jgi:hypothetical protein